MIQTITFDEIELDVQCFYIPPEKGNWESPDYPGYYDIGDIFYKGVEVSLLLEEFSKNYLEKIQELINED